MKNKAVNFIIHILGVGAAFLLFSLDPFIAHLIDKSEILFPWWLWGISGVILFEVVYFVAFFMRRKE